MLELPEVVTLARQITEELRGATVASCERGNSPHKWAWYSGDADFYAANTVGKRIGAASAEGNRVVIALEPGWELAIGDMGGKILLHADESTIPRKRHLMLGFADGRVLTVAIAGWGGMWLKAADDPNPAWFVGNRRVSPIGDEFSYDCFKGLLEEDAARRKCSVKAFLASDPLLTGIGNGYVQEICFRARLHPKRDITTLSGRERQGFYRAIRGVLSEAIAAGGRDTESDLHGAPGGYVAVMDQRARGKPCPGCGTPIEKIAYLGGSCYLCPRCQVG